MSPQGPGRPKIGPSLKVKVTPEVAAHIDAMADAEGITRSEATRRLLDAAVADEATEADTTGGAA